MENESRSNFYRALIIGFLLTISTVTRVEYYLVDGPDNFYSLVGISVFEIKDQENELISILNKHNDQIIGGLECAVNMACSFLLHSK